VYLNDKTAVRYTAGVNVYLHTRMLTRYNYNYICTLALFVALLM